VGNVSIISGPIPGLFEGAPTGVKAYFAYINSKGGVHGRKLMVDGYDDNFNAEQNQSDTTTALSKDFGLVGDFSLFDNSGCKVLAENPAVPNVSVTLDPGTNALPNTFSSQPLAVGWNLGPLQFYKKHYPKDLTVGALVSNVPTAVAQWNGEKAALAHVGYKIGYERTVGPLESDFTTDIIHMKNDGVNVIDMTALDWQVAAIMVQDMTQQGWKPALIMSGGPVYADQFIKTAGGPAATNGIWVGQEQSLYLGQDASTVPAVNTFLSWVKKVNPSWTPDLYTLFGWTSAALFVQALQAAGPNPTRGEVLAQLKKITNFNANGIIATDNPAQKLPPTCYLMARIVNGNFVRQDDPSGGFRCDGSFYYANASSAG
jgi:ABC-type branched-subunit amino acid transport system substrate-binding protein